MRGWARVQSTAGFCAAFGRRRARKVRKRKTTVDRDRSQLSIKKRTTKKCGDGEEGAFLAWVCSSSGVHDPRCDHSRTHGLRIYPGSVAGVGGFRLGRLGLSSSKTLVPRAIVNGSKYIHFRVLQGGFWGGRSTCLSMSI